MRILLVNYRYFLSGGPERYMFNIKRLLEERGNEVIPFSVRSKKNEPCEYEGYFVDPIGNEETVYYEDIKKTPRAILKLITRSFYSAEVKKAIEGIIKDTNPDIVYVLHFVNKLSPSVISGAKRAGIPVVVRLSDFNLLCPRFDFFRAGKVCEDCVSRGYYSCLKYKCVKKSLLASLVRVASMKFHMMIKVYDQVDAFVCPSKFLKNKLIENGYDEKKIYHIPTFTEGSNNSIINLGEYGLYLGRLEENKGLFTAIKAYELLKNRTLLIVGDNNNSYTQEMMAYVRNNKLENIVFLGKKTGIELDNIISNSRFVIIPSIWYDNLPNVGLESMIRSKPIIASDLGSLPELVEDGYNGFLFPPSNYIKLSEFICKMDDDSEVIKMGKNSYKKVETEYSVESHYEKLIGLFSDVMIDSSKGL